MDRDVLLSKASSGEWSERRLTAAAPLAPRLAQVLLPHHHGARIRTLKRRTRDTYKMDGLFIGSIVSAAVAPDIHTSQKNGMNGGPFQVTEIHLSSRWMCGEPIPRPV